MVRDTVPSAIRYLFVLSLFISYRRATEAFSTRGFPASLRRGIRTTSTRTTAHRSAPSFPVDQLTPKDETQASAFLAEHPTFDGRGVTIAVLDTGVDPLAPGLQFTSDGRPKIVDLVDATGSGDVDTRVVRRADAEGTVRGLSGRRLRVANTSAAYVSAAAESTWRNPSGEWRVGLLAAFDLFPHKLSDKVERQRSERIGAARSAALLRAYDERTTAATAPPSNSSSVLKGELLTEELDARVELLEVAMRDDDDETGPMFDVVFWHDGDAWRAVLSEVVPLSPSFSSSSSSSFSSSSPGGVWSQDAVHDLVGSLEPMTDFRAERQVGCFSDDTALFYTLRMNEGCEEGGRSQGCSLSVVTNSGSHGTHVAAIAAAHYGNRTISGGLAPGAQIVSVKIGDARFGTMETGQSLARALAAVARDPDIDVINLSYGDAVGRPNFGRLVEMCSDLVRRHGKIFVSSAGNQGPALTSCSAPGSTTPALIGVGAYLSSAMKKTAYSMYPISSGDKSSKTSTANAPSEDDPQNIQSMLPAQQYSFSSRGPSPDGHLGVSLSAPGGAMAAIPAWCEQGEQIMHGTSMASPNAVGNIACLISALRERGIPYSPFSVRRALEATATRAPEAKRRRAQELSGDDDDNEDEDEEEVFSLGYGLLQVADAFDAIVADASAATRAVASTAAVMPETTSSRRPSRALDAFVDFVVSVLHPSTHTSMGVNAGIYIREPIEQATPRQYSVEINPLFPPNTPPAAKAAFGTMPVNLVVRYANSKSDSRFGGGKCGGWVAVAEHLALPAAGRSFKVMVDPRSLPPGAHFAEVLGYDADKASSSIPIFRLPITVIKNHDQFASSPQPPLMSPVPSGDTLPSSASTMESSSTTDDSAVKESPQGTSSMASSETCIGPLVLGPGNVQRRFLSVPSGATAVDIHLTLLQKGGVSGERGGESVDNGASTTAAPTTKTSAAGSMPHSRTIHLHCMQLSPHVAPQHSTLKRRAILAPGETAFGSMSVVGGGTLEVCTTQDWASIGDMEVPEGSGAGVGGGSVAQLRLVWRRLAPSTRQLRIAGAKGYTSVELTNHGTPTLPPLIQSSLPVKSKVETEEDTEVATEEEAEAAREAPREQPQEINVAATLSGVTDLLRPVARLRTWVQPLRPSASVIRPMPDDRDKWPTAPTTTTNMAAAAKAAAEAAAAAAEAETANSAGSESKADASIATASKPAAALPFQVSSKVVNNSPPVRAVPMARGGTESTGVAAGAESEASVVNDAGGEAAEETSDLQTTYEMVLQYNFEQPKGYKKTSVTPHILSVHGELYESPFTGVLTMVYNSNGELVGMRDALSQPIALGPSSMDSDEVEANVDSAPDAAEDDSTGCAGDFEDNSNSARGNAGGASGGNGGAGGGANCRKYTVLVQLRHHQPEVLHAFRDVELWLERPLETDLAVRIFHDRSSAVLSQGAGPDVPGVSEEETTADVGSRGMSTTTKVRPFRQQRLMPGQRKMLYLSGPPGEKLPKAAAPGDFLGGDIYYYLTGRNGVGRKYPLSYLVPPPQRKPTSNNKAASAALEKNLANVAPIPLERASQSDQGSSEGCKQQSEKQSEQPDKEVQPASAEEKEGGGPVSVAEGESPTNSSSLNDLENRLADARREWELGWLAKQIDGTKASSSAAKEARQMMEDLLAGVGANETAAEGSTSPAEGVSQADADKAAEERMKKAKEEIAVLLEMRLVDLLKQMWGKESGGAGLVTSVVDTADALIATVDQEELATYQGTRRLSFFDDDLEDEVDGDVAPDDEDTVSDDDDDDNAYDDDDNDDDDDDDDDDEEVIAVGKGSGTGHELLVSNGDGGEPSSPLDQSPTNGADGSSNADESKGKGKTAKAKKAEAAEKGKAMNQAKERLVRALRIKVAALSRGGLVAGGATTAEGGGAGRGVDAFVSLRGPIVIAEATAAAGTSGARDGAEEEQECGPGLALDTAFAEAVQELGRWEDVAGHSAVGIFYEWALRRRPAVALKLLNAAINAGGNGGHGGRTCEPKGEMEPAVYGAASELKTLRLLRVRLLDELGWAAHADLERLDIVRRYPPIGGFRPF